MRPLLKAGETMSLNDEQSPPTLGRILLFVLACVLAVALPLVVMKGLSGGDADPTAGEPGSTPASALTTGAGVVLGAATAATPATPATAATAATAATHPASPAPAKLTVGVAELADEAETCRLANLRQQAPLSAADVSLAQFDKHIDAMNLLVAGKISLSVATTFWDETRVAAADNARIFHQADKELTKSKAECRALDPAVANASPYGQVVVILSCSQAVTARRTALARARTAVTTWEHHVHDMEMLRMGHLTPGQATAAWQKNWKTGEKQLAAYEKAAAAARKIPCSLN
jgi:hypothetical protein